MSRNIVRILLYKHFFLVLTSFRSSGIIKNVLYLYICKLLIIERAKIGKQIQKQGKY
jgi:hypothetical protein